MERAVMTNTKTILDSKCYIFRALLGAFLEEQEGTINDNQDENHDHIKMIPIYTIDDDGNDDRGRVGTQWTDL
eukprot:3553133-Amphidinium_carterae.1